MLIQRSETLELIKELGNSIYLRHIAVHIHVMKEHSLSAD